MVLEAFRAAMIWWVFLIIALLLLLLIIAVILCCYCKDNDGDEYPGQQKFDNY
jgi:hypothetical protein